MKKGWKIFWLICLIIAGIGLGICVAGFAIGFDSDDVERAFGDDVKYIEKSIVTYQHSEEDENIIHSDEVTVNESPDDTKLEKELTTVDETEIENLEGYKNVKAIDINMDAGELVVKAYDGKDVRCDFSRGEADARISVEQDGEELNINLEGKKKRIFGTSHLDVGHIVIYVPESISLEEFSLDVGAGDVAVGNVTAKQMSLEVGAGRIAYHPNRDLNSFNYNMECGIGQIRIGDGEYSGLGMEKNIENGAAYNIDMDCGVGEIVVKFSN